MSVRDPPVPPIIEQARDALERRQYLRAHIVLGSYLLQHAMDVPEKFLRRWHRIARKLGAPARTGPSRPQRPREELLRQHERIFQLFVDVSLHAERASKRRLRAEQIARPCARQQALARVH